MKFSVPTIGFEKSSYSVVEGDTVTICVTVMCGRLLRNETVMLSIINTTRGHCMNIVILHAVDENLLCFYFFVYSWDRLYCS